MTTKKISKGKTIEDLCALLGTDDYTRLVPQIEKLVDINIMPPRGVMIAWKPFVQGSLTFTIMGFPVDSVVDLQEASQVCGIVSQNLSARAIEVAQQSGMVQNKKEEITDDQREPNRQES